MASNDMMINIGFIYNFKAFQHLGFVSAFLYKKYMRNWGIRNPSVGSAVEMQNYHMFI